MSPKSLPPPPEPDPLTLDQIYDNITSSESSADVRAYNIVALNTVAFHPTVKLFLFEYHSTLPSSTSSEECPSLSASSSSEGMQNGDDRTKQSNAFRRETLLKNVAFFLCIRNSPVSRECRWETLSLLGELCRMEQSSSSSASGKGDSSISCHSRGHNGASDQHKHNSVAQVWRGSSSGTYSSSPSAFSTLQDRLNAYAKANLEYLATLPWFRTTLENLLKSSQKEKNNGINGVGSSTSTSNGILMTTGDSSSSNCEHGVENKLTREEIREKFQERRQQRKLNESKRESDDWREIDEDILIVIGDILRAMPTVTREDSSNKCKVEWTPENLEQAHDLMFLDASTSVAHLIPLVSRSYSNCCANCLLQAKSPFSSPSSPGFSDKKNEKCRNDDNSTATSTTCTTAETASGFPRCSGCKSVFYCSPECQRAHWGTTHRQPCMAYKERKQCILSQYYAQNSKGKQSGKRNHRSGDVAILEVPLEPSLYFETRRFLYDHRDVSFEKVSFSDYFLKYTVRGS